MKIKKGTLLEVDLVKEGRFIGSASEDFDTSVANSYPIIVAEENRGCVKRYNLKWHQGESIPCRRGYCTVKIIK